MKRTLLVAATSIVAAFVLSQPSVYAQPAPDDTVQTITQLENDWGVALVKNDQATIDRIEAPEWMMSDPDGALSTKAQGDADMKNGVYHYTAFHNDALDVHVYGDTAIVFGLETETSTYKGADSSGQYRFTDVFVKRNGQWQAVATHVSKVAKH